MLFEAPEKKREPPNGFPTIDARVASFADSAAPEEDGSPGGERGRRSAAGVEYGGSQFPSGAGAEEVLLGVAQTLGLGAFISDPQGRILWANDAIEGEFPGIFARGRSADEALGEAAPPDPGLLPDPIAEQLERGSFGRRVPEGALRARVLPGGEMRTYRHHTFSLTAASSGRHGRFAAGKGCKVHCLINTTPEKKLADTYRTSQHELSSVKEILDILYESITSTRDVMNLILVAVTSRFGFGFNRAFFLQVQGDLLRGRLGIGPANPADANRIWSRLAESNPTLRESLRLLSQTGGPPDPATAELAMQISIPLSGPRADEAGIVQAIRGGKAALLYRRDDLPHVDEDLFKLLGSRALAVVPLRIGQELKGVLIADNFITQKPISEEDLGLLKTFSGYAGIALERSRLYDELRQNVEKLQDANGELQSNQKKLMQAEKLSAIGELAAFVSHEIRNPLVAIGGLARSALADGSERPETVEALSIIAKEVTRLERFLKETLDFVKPSATLAEEVDLNEVALESLATFREELVAHGIEAYFEPTEEGIPVRLDSHLLRGALSNLIKNAIEAMNGGGRLRLRSLQKGALVRIQVADTGPGIPPEMQRQIFDPFFTTKKGGTGLGLAMSQQSVKSLGGTIALETHGDGGEFRTEFSITLPIGRKDGGRP